MTVLLKYACTTYTYNPTTTGTGVSGGALTNASCAALGYGDQGYATDHVYTVGPHNSATNIANAITNASYISFVMTPTAGYSIALVNLTFSQARGGATSPRGWGVRSSVDAYAASLGTADCTTQRTTFATADVDLSGAGFQALTTATTFRIYWYSPASSYTVDFDDITLNGTATLLPTGNPYYAYAQQ